jgi:hypothetical protein
MEQSGAPYPCNEGLGELVPPPTPGKSVKTPDAKGAWCCTMALHRPAAEPGKVIWEMSVEMTGQRRCDVVSPTRAGYIVVCALLITACMACSGRSEAGDLDRLLAEIKDSNHATRAKAAAGLGEMDDPRAWEALAGALKDPVESVRKAADEAMLKLTVRTTKYQFS